MGGDEGDVGAMCGVSAEGADAAKHPARLPVAATLQ